MSRVPSTRQAPVGARATEQLPLGRQRLYLVDTSAWARLPREQTVADRLVQAHEHGQIVLALPIVLELGFSARNSKEHERVMAEVDAFPLLPFSAATSELAAALQSALWHNGRVRAAGAMDTMLAALAIEHGATVLHYDRDYENLARVEPTLSHEWVAAPGSMN